MSTAREEKANKPIQKTEGHQTIKQQTGSKEIRQQRSRLKIANRKYIANELKIRDCRQ